MSSLGGNVFEGKSEEREPEQASGRAMPALEGGDEAVNYEETALVEIELAGTEYRLDSGRAGTALCISTRPSGSWSWVFRGEARWQNNVLRCKAFDREVLTQLSRALADVAADAQS